MSMIMYGNGVERDLDYILPGCIGPGWNTLVRTLVDDLLALGWNRTLLQMKEKFGGLRFYIGEGSSEMFDRIHQAEGQSLEICEQCGAPGELRTDRSWLKTLCEGCNNA